MLCVPKQSPQNTVHLYSIHANHCKPQALQPAPPRTHAAVPNGSRALRDLARVGQRGSVRRPGRSPHTQALCVQGVCKISGVRHLCPWLCPRSLRRLWARLLCSLLLQRPGSLPLVHHPAHGGDSSAPERSRIPPPAGAPVGAVGSQAASLLHAARRASAQYGAAHLRSG